MQIQEWKDNYQNGKELFIANFSLSASEEKQLSFFPDKVFNKPIPSNI